MGPQAQKRAITGRQTEHLLPSPKASTGIGLAAKASPRFPKRGPEAQCWGSRRGKRPKGPDPKASEPGLPGSARRASGPARPRRPNTRAEGRGPAVGKRPRPGPSAWRPRHRGCHPSPVQTVPGGRGAARLGRGRCARGPKGNFPAAREKGSECQPREGRGGPLRRCAWGRGWGRGGLPVSLAAATAATHPAPPDERYHWQQEEDGGRCRRREGGGGPVGAAERGYAQDVGVAATASFLPRSKLLLLTTLLLASAPPS